MLDINLEINKLLYDNSSLNSIFSQKVLCLLFFKKVGQPTRKSVAEEKISSTLRSRTE